MVSVALSQVKATPLNGERRLVTSNSEAQKHPTTATTVLLVVVANLFMILDRAWARTGLFWCSGNPTKRDVGLHALTIGKKGR
jgi:hypothetical protein